MVFPKSFSTNFPIQFLILIFLPKFKLYLYRFNKLLFHSLEIDKDLVQKN